MKNFKIYTNLFLLFFACIAIAFLIKYTDVTNTGIAKNLNEGIENLKRIVRDPVPQSELTEAEKESLKKALQKPGQSAPLFCQSNYFPYLAGAKWRYQLVAGTGNDIIEIGVPSGEGGSIYLDGRLLSREKWTVRTILQCVDGRIKITDLNFLSIFKQDRLVTTPCENGQFNFFLPRDAELVKDSTWTQNGCLIREQLDSEYRKKETETKLDLSVRWKMLGAETVNVPAGEFMAQRAELQFSDSLINFWAAKGVGIVKITYKEVGTESATITQELVEYQIPTEREYKFKN